MTMRWLKTFSESSKPSASTTQAGNFEEANKMIDDYIYFYNHERIQLKTGLSPLSLRQSG